MPAASTKTMLGKGATIGYSVASGAGPYTYTPLMKVQSINPGLTVGEVEDTTLDSNFEAYLPTIPAGECGFVMRHRPGDAGVVLVLGWVLSPTIVHWQVSSNDGSTLIFDGFVKGYTKTFENKTIVDADVPMRIVTEPVFTPAA
jgi:hypothetical protein